MLAVGVSQNQGFELSVWHDSFVISLLAETAQTDPGLSIKDFAVPIGVILGAVIGAVAAWLNTRVSVYERLETLTQIRKDWPDGVPGVETVEHSISLALAEIRNKEPGHEIDKSSVAEILAESEVRIAQRGQILASMLLTVISALSAAAIIGLARAGQEGKLMPFVADMLTDSRFQNVAGAVVVVVTILTVVWRVWRRHKRREGMKS